MPVVRKTNARLGGEMTTTVTAPPKSRSQQREAQDATEDQWPWGPSGRPSDGGESAGHMAQRPNELVGEPQQWRNRLGALKPNEPEGEPGPSSRVTRATAEEDETDTVRGGRPTASLTPNLSWQVRKVQEHMSVSRWRGSTTRSPCSEDQ